MKATFRLFVIATAMLHTSGSVAAASEIRVWTARAIATVLAEVGPQFERATGHTIVISSDLSSGFERRMSGGETFDIVISGSEAIDSWIKNERIVAESRKEVARSVIGVGVRAGARKPDISSVAAFKRALLDARSIAFLKVGSGVHIAKVIGDLGIAETVKSKVIRPDSDVVSELVAKGEVELGLVVITQIMTTPGVELAGPLPPELQYYLTFVGGISPRSKVSGAAMQLMEFLTDPLVMHVIRSQGMEPATSKRE